MVLRTLDEAKDVASSRKDYTSTAVQGLGMLAPLKDAIPDEYGLSVVKGVLGLVFEVTEICCISVDGRQTVIADI